MEKLIIFDLDGTLFKSETVAVKAINKALINNGYEPRKKEDIINLIGGTLEEISVQLLGTSNEKTLERFKKDVIHFEKEGVAKSGKLYDGVMDALHRMKSLNYKLAICTNEDEEVVDEISRKFELHNIFHDISSHNKLLSKSQRVEALKNKHNVDRFIMVGDRTSDIKAARSNNGVPIGVTYGFGEREVFSADFVANDIEQVEHIIFKI